MSAKNKLDSLQSGYDGKIWVEYVDDIAIIRMECGENRFNNRFLEAFNRCLDDILRHDEVKAVITVGSGKFYSNGIDLMWLKEVGSVSVDDLVSFISIWHNTLRRLLLFPLPTVAAINGHCYAGGAMLSLCHDYRVMQTDRGWWSVNEVHMGLQIPKWLVKLILLKVLGSKAQADVLLFGKRLTAEEALNLEVIHTTTSSETLLQQAVKMARESGNETLKRENIEMMKKDAFAEVLKVFDEEIQSLPETFGASSDKVKALSSAARKKVGIVSKM